MTDKDIYPVWQEFRTLEEAITVLGYSDYKDFREGCTAKVLYDEQGHECGVLVKEN